MRTNSGRPGRNREARRTDWQRDPGEGVTDGFTDESLGVVGRESGRRSYSDQDRNNCSAPDDILAEVKGVKNQLQRLQLFFPSYWMLKA